MKKPYKKATLSGIVLKKQYGQHFLRDEALLTRIVAAVPLTERSSVFEIGCGNGALTRVILHQPLARLWVFEIDEAWAQHVREQLPDQRLTIFTQDVLQADLSAMEPHKPWILIANLPYQISFPLFYRLQELRALLQEGVVMLQEEVAQKLVAQSGRSYGYTSLFFQHYFVFRLLEKVPPELFYPAPKVNSRVIHFKPRTDQPEIVDEQKFWKFIKLCFAQPRRTLYNNLVGTPYRNVLQKTAWDSLRAQQMSFEQFLTLWNYARSL